MWFSSRTSHNCAMECSADQDPRGRPLRARPDRGQVDAVLAAVKAWPGSGSVCGECVATASLDGGCARRLGARAGRDGETVS
jgi:hypothetical protein